MYNATLIRYLGTKAVMVPHSLATLEFRQQKDMVITVQLGEIYITCFARRLTEDPCPEYELLRGEI